MRLAPLTVVLVVACTFAVTRSADAQYGTPAPHAKSDNATPSMLADIGIDQKLGAQLPMDVPFVNERGEAVMLRDLIRERPVVLSLVYYGCPMLCTTVLNNQLRAFSGLTLTMGKEYDVISISFDPSETAELAAKKQREYARKYARDGAAASSWHFLTGKPESIAAITQAVGFRYAWDEPTKQFLHPGGLMIVSPGGKVTRYFFGVDYEPTDLRLSLLEAGEGKVGSLTDKILLYCYQYDATRGKYGFAIRRAIQAGGVITIAALAGGVVFMLRRERTNALKSAV